MRPTRVLWLGLSFLIMAGCGPAAPAARDAAPSGDPAALRSTRAMQTVMRTEPPALASKPLAAPGISVRHATRIFNAELDFLDGREVSHPYLAEALPQLNTESWQVFPDGRMETAYRLKPNLVWHDGTPLSAEDFVFAWRVYALPTLGTSSLAPIAQIEEIVASDARALVIRWNRLYPDAAALKDEFQALPRHILGSTFENEPPDALLNHPYWTWEYVGLGPYRLERWEPGAFIEAVAFDRHVLGRPKIERIVIRFSQDENTNLANLLAGAVDVATDRAIRFEQAMVLRREWGPERKGTPLLTPGQPRFTMYQFRPEVVSPRAILDVRVRRALASTIDRQAINDGVFGGEGAMAETFVTPNLSYAGELNRIITHYPYDSRRAEELMAEAGFTKDREGLFASGERLGVGFMVEAGAQNERDLAIMENTWRRAGFDIRPQIIAASQLRDQQLRATFPAMYSTATGGGERNALAQFTSPEAPRPENRWAGSNRGAFMNPEVDRLFEAFSTTLERPERDRQAIELLKIVSDQVPSMMLYFNFYVSAHNAAVHGPDPNAYDTLVFWNIHEWEIR
jgi:peptide/nickel transport system substrate-binding protein